MFDTPSDKLIWDVGHQAYPHKIVTGRRDRIRTLRQGGGLSGFTKRSESEFDPFGSAQLNVHFRSPSASQLRTSFPMHRARPWLSSATGH